VAISFYSGPGAEGQALGRKGWRCLTAPLAVLALALAGYGQLLSPGKIPYSPHSDLVAYHLAAKQVLHRSLAAGDGLPLWRSDQLSGTPIFTSPNALFTNPLHLLYYFCDPVRATGPTLLLLLITSALAFYLVARSLRLGFWPRLLMAVAGLFSFKLILAAYAGWLGPLCALVAFPLLFAAVFFMAEEPGPRAGLALAGSAALCLHGGQLQVPYYAAWFALVYLVLVSIRLWRQGARAAARSLVGWSTAGGLCAVAMSLYILWPTAAEASLISRAQASAAFAQSGHALAWRHLLTLLWPEALGTPLRGSYAAVELWEDAAYFGLIPLALAAFGVGFGHRRTTAKFLAISLLLSLLLALDSVLVRAVYRLVPGGGLFRSPGRMLFVTAFFGITLAGIGLEEILLRLRQRRADARVPTLIAVLLLLLVAGEGVIHARRYIDTAAPSAAFPAGDYARFLAQDKDLFRVAPLARTSLAYGSAASLGLQIISGYEPYNLGHYQEYVHLMQSGKAEPGDAVVWTDVRQIRRWDLLDTLGAKYILASEPAALPPDRFELAGHFPHESVHMFYKGERRTDVFVYRNRFARERAFLPEQVLAVPDHATALGATARTSLGEVAVVETAEAAQMQPSPGDQVRVAGASDGRLDIEATTEARRFLVLAEVWHPGWHAFLDGREVPLVRADVALMGLWLPPGAHHLSLRFRPLHFRTSLVFSLMAITLFVAGSAWLSWRARQKERDGV